MLDNVLTFLAGNLAIASIKVEYATQYGAIVTQWLDKDIDTDALKLSLAKLKETIDEPYAEH